MAEKRIEIQIAATGGDQAAAEVKKVQDAHEELSAGTSEGSVSAEELNQKFEDLRKKTADLRKENADFGEEQEKSTRNMRLGAAAAVGAGIGGAILSKTFGEIAKGLASIDTDKLRDMDSAMADQIDTAKGWAEILTDPMNGIQRLISGTTINEAFADVNEQLARNAEMQAQAMDRMITAGRKTAEELKQVASDIAAANAIIDAAAEADAKERDAQDAGRVRGGEAPEDVRAERAKFNRDRELERINRDLDPKAKEAQSLYDDAQTAKGNATRVASDPRADAEAIAKAKQSAAEAEKKAADALKDYENAKRVAEEQRRGVRAEYEGEVGDAAGDKKERLEKEREKAQREKAAEAKREADRERRERIEDLEKQRESAADGLDRASKSAAGTIAGSSNRNPTLQGIGNTLADGTDAREIARVGQEIAAKQGQLGTVTEAALQKVLQSLNEALNRVSNLEGQLKVLRRTK